MFLEVSSLWRRAPVPYAATCRKVTGDRGLRRRPTGRRDHRSPADEQGDIMAETYSGEFYCVKCKEKREASGDVHVNDKGTRMAKAKCPVCGTNLNRILGKA
jgi:hypothetical protein